MNIHSGGDAEVGAYKTLYGALSGALSFFFGTTAELKHKREAAQIEHPGATLDALDHVAANEDDIGGME